MASNTRRTMHNILEFLIHFWWIWPGAAGIGFLIAGYVVGRSDEELNQARLFISVAVWPLTLLVIALFVPAFLLWTAASFAGERHKLQLKRQKRFTERIKNAR